MAEPASAEVSLPAEPSSSRYARRWVGSRLTELHLEPLLDAVELLTSEVVTNVLIHAGTPMRLRLRPDGAGVQVEVHDGSVHPPSRRHYSSSATTGRGVEVLDSLADEWGWRADPGGKTVWFRVLQAREVWRPMDLDGLTAAEQA